MTKAIQQSVKLGLPPAQLYRIFLDSRKHSQVTCAPARISRKVGGTFTAYGSLLRGKNLLLVPGKMIVQAWRGTHWKASDPDSILILQFSKARGGGQIDLVHVNVPSHDHAGVKKGWPKYYWRPWMAYIARRARKS